MSTQFEVHHPLLEPYLGCVVCLTAEEAKALASLVTDASGLNFQVREVTVGHRDPPPINPVPTPILVDEVRKLMSIHGQDVIAVCAWSNKTGNVCIATAGSDPLHSHFAQQLGIDFSRLAGCEPEAAQLEERREHAQS